jgi:hypothetical protein
MGVRVHIVTTVSFSHPPAGRWVAPLIRLIGREKLKAGA